MQHKHQQHKHKGGKVQRKEKGIKKTKGWNKKVNNNI